MHMYLFCVAPRDETALMESPISIPANGFAAGRRFARHDLFRTLVENVADAIFLIDLDSEECIYVSPSVRALLGRDAEELIGRPLTDFVHPDDKERVVARSASRRRGRGSPTNATRMSHRDGK